MPSGHQNHVVRMRPISSGQLIEQLRRLNTNSSFKSAHVCIRQSGAVIARRCRDQDRRSSIFAADTSSLTVVSSLGRDAWHAMLVWWFPCHDQWKWSMADNVCCDTSRLIDWDCEIHHQWRSAVEESDHGSASRAVVLVETVLDHV